MKTVLRWAGIVLVIGLLSWLVLHPDMHHTEGSQRKTLPSIRLRDLNGEWKTLESWSGKVRVISFWATWCEPCVVEMPSLEALANTFKDQAFAVVGINMEDENKLGKIQLFTRQNKIHFPVLRDPFGDAATAFGVDALPRNLIIDKHDRVVYEETGPRRWNSPEIVARIRRLIETP